MKFWKVILFGSLIALLASCSNDLLDQDSNTRVYSSFGFIYHDTNTDYYIITDNADTLEILYTYDYFNFEDSTRVRAYFRIEEELPSSEDHYSVTINRIDQILYKDVIDYDESISDSLGSDPIEIISIWQTGVNLNVEFVFYGGGTRHYINLSKPAGTIEDPSSPVELTLRHNANDDDILVKLKSIVTFNLENLKSEASDTTKYKIISTDYHGNNYTFNGMVVFD